MDGSLLGQDFAAHIAVAWGVSIVVLGGLTGWALWQYRKAGKDLPRD